MSRFAERAEVSPIRRLLLNLYEKPSGDPTVGAVGELDATEPRAFLFLRDMVKALTDPAGYFTSVG